MKKLIAANWKMNKTVPEAVSAAKELKKLIKNVKNAEVAIFPPFTALEAVGKELKKSKIKLGAQNMHFEDYGAYTGDISPLMLKNAGCEYVILGHSERREFFKEDDVLINKKVVSALSHKLKPILCVGENLEERNRLWTQEVLEKQLNNCLQDVAKKQMENVVIAYEPVWAISRGDPSHKAATSKDAEEGHALIRKFLSIIFGMKTADNARIIYGGSMKPENAKDLLSRKGVDGGLVGNASLNAKSFAEIVRAAY